MQITPRQSYLRELQHMHAYAQTHHGSKDILQARPLLPIAYISRKRHQTVRASCSPLEIPHVRDRSSHGQEGAWGTDGGTGGGGERKGAGVRATHLAHKGLMGVAEFAEVQQSLHHWLLQCLLGLFLTVLVPVDITTRPRPQNCLHTRHPLLNTAQIQFVLSQSQGLLLQLQLGRWYGKILL